MACVQWSCDVRGLLRGLVHDNASWRCSSLFILHIYGGKKRPGSGDARVHFVILMSAGRQGAAQDKLWQLEQELKGPSCLNPPPPSVVQWHLLFKFTPAAVKCNATRPLSKAAGTEAQRLWKTRPFRENSRFCVFYFIPSYWLDSSYSIISMLHVASSRLKSNWI